MRPASIVAFAVAFWTSVAPAKTQEEIFRSSIVVPIPRGENIVTKRGIGYGSADATQRADIYRPAGAKRVGAVVFIHGGFPEIPGLHGRESGQYQSWGRLIAASGLAAVTFDHRLRVGSNGAMHVEEAVSDAKTLLSWLRTHGGEHSIDPDRLCLFAVAAGGPLLAASAAGASGIRRLVDYYGFADVHGVAMFANGVAPDRASELSLVDLLGAARLPPLLVARAGRDAVPQMKESIDRFVTRALAADAELTLLDHANGPHAFDVLDDSARTREIIDATVTFLRANLSRI